MPGFLILDYGSQFTQIIARKARELGAYCEIHPHQNAAAIIDKMSPDGIILSGGPQSVLSPDAPTIDEKGWNCLNSEQKPIPVLGVCYGMQAMARHFGGEVMAGEGREYGGATINANEKGLFTGLPKSFTVWMSHGDRILTPPPKFDMMAASSGKENEHVAVVAAIQHQTHPWYGVQFHPEVSHTENGVRILSNFIKEVCGDIGEWTMPNFIERATEDIVQQTAGEEVLLALSGGVDSTVLAALLHRAIGDRLHCVMVDNGLLRENEADAVRNALGGHFGVNITVIDAADRFFNALKSIDDPEQKRKIIGAQFIAEFEAYADKHTEAKWLAQGTIYPDVVESAGVAGGGKAVIKSHHNVGGLPERLNLKLLEPLRELFKDEVRRLGEALGLPSETVNRHPFPGPGLAVRVLGEVTPERVEIARRADSILMSEMRDAGWYKKTAQAFVVLLPVRSVGVMGDSRTYENAAVIRAVTTSDFMTADWARLPHDFLARVSSRIINSVPGINRVAYDVSSKPPATVEWE